MGVLFTTEGMSSGIRFRRWSEVIFDRIVPVEQACLSDRPFEGKLEALDVGSLPITRVSQGALRTEATPRTIRRHDKHDTVSVTLKLAGVSTSAQDGRESVQGVGDLVVLDRRPAILSSSDRSRSLFLEVPRARMETALGPTSLYTALTIGATQASMSLATTFLHELMRVHHELAPATAERMASILIDLIVASIAERLAREVPKPLHGTLVVQRAKTYVEANLGNQSLGPTQLAAAVGVSLRRLQQLFQDREQQVSDWIWQRRLDVAARHVADPNSAHLSIGTIAHSCGFPDQSHFSRRFKRRFDMTPSEYRRASIMKIST